MAIIDIGSQDINGSYRPLFQLGNWQYFGADLAHGRNVDLVLSDMYSWAELQDNSVDAIISGQAFEHIEFFWLTMREIGRILKPDGLLCLIAPSGGFEHRYPVDCWRFYPDGMRALARYAGLEVLSAYAQWDRAEHPDMDLTWKDCVLIAKKPSAPDQARCEPSPTPGHSDLQRWWLDHPRQGDALKRGQGPIDVLVRGWVLAKGEAPVRLALRERGLVRCYRLNEQREDVVTKVLKAEAANHPRLTCGFRHRIRIWDDFELGFEVGGQIRWLTSWNVE